MLERESRIYIEVYMNERWSGIEQDMMLVREIE